MKLLKSLASIGSSVKKVDFTKFNYNKFDYFHDKSNRYITIHFNNDKSIRIVAQSDWGISYIVKLKGMPFSKLTNKVIKSIKEIKNKQKIENAFIGIKHVDFTNDPDHEYSKFHLYEIKLEDEDDTFNFGLINASNGYYDGWIEIYLL